MKTPNLEFLRPKEEKPITKGDVPQDVILELEKDFYKSFDFMKLYTPAEEGNAKLLSIIQTIIVVITLIVIIMK